jgi:hypothetical protein
MARRDVIDELMERACPSIRYRTGVELAGRPASGPGMVELQRQILQDDAVREVASWQQPDGWLAWDFHGTRSLEAGVRLLCEKGVDPEHPLVARALQALAEHTDRLERGIGRVGRILDERGFGGSEMIRAVVFAYAGHEDNPLVREQVGEALTGFRAVLDIEEIDELAEPYRGKPVFKPGLKWPSLYHLRLLALTQGWRTPDSRAMMAASVGKLVALSPIPEIHVRHRSQLIAPASFGMHDFRPGMGSMGAAAWMMWLQRMELLARSGVVSSVPALARQIEVLRAMLDAGGGRFTQRLSHPYFKQWGSYTGLMLEKDWRWARRREYDLTFRSLLILHFAAEGAA